MAVGIGFTRAQFRSLIGEFVAYEGTSYITSDWTSSSADADNFINERLSLFSELTMCLFSEAEALTTAAGEQTYNLFDTAKVATRIWLPTNVIINNSVLKTLDGKYGPISMDELLGQGYFGASNGTPTRWARQADHQIAFDVPASGAISNSFVQGYRHPADIAAGAGTDSSSIDLPEQYQRTAAVFCAIAALQPRASDGIVARMQHLNAAAAQEMQMLMNKSSMLMNHILGDPTRSDQQEAV